jgi:hypothetical protein
VLESRGVPAVAVLTEVFANLGATAARARGYADLRTVVLPHPMETRTAEEIRSIAAERLDEIAELLTGSRRPLLRRRPGEKG